MKETYRKFGETIRFERGALGEAWIRVSEAGEAEENGDRFRSYPLPFRERPNRSGIDEQEVLAAVEEIERLATPPLQLERLIVTAGSATHQFAGIEWEEDLHRLHVSLRHGSVRTIIDSADLELQELRRAVEVLRRFDGEERQPPSQLRLEPNVAAAVVSSMLEHRRPGLDLQQLSGGFDGKGQPVDQMAVSSPPWPNWYRPSYRARPQRSPLNLFVAADEGTIDEDVPRAAAILGPIGSDGVHALCAGSDERVFATRFVVERVLKASGPRRWYPYGAGAFGSDMLVETGILDF